MNWAIVVNPTSGKRKGLELGHAIRVAIESAGHSSTWVCETSAAGTKERLGSLVSQRVIDAVIVVGGDGLVNLTVQEVAATQIPMGVVPAGTGNDFARASGTFGKPVAELVKAFLSENPTAIDLGRVTFTGGNRWFGQVMSTGFDSVVNERANSFQRLRGKIKYTVATLLELPVFQPKEYRIVADGVVRQTRAMLVAIANGPTYGGGMRICPDANRQDGLFDIMILSPVPKTEFIRVFPKVFSGKHTSHPKVEIIRARSITIDSDAKVFADGEDYGRPPLTAEVVPQALLTWVLS